MLEVCGLFGLAKLGVAMVCLLYASFKDFKFREVPNKVWGLFFPTVLALSVVEYTFFASELALFFVVMFSVCFLVSTAFYVFGVFGGADFKCMLCVGVAFPFACFMVFTLVWVYVFMYMFFNFFRNLAEGKCEGLFNGELANEGALRKVYVLFVARKVRVVEVYRKWWVVPVEYMGKFNFKIKSDDRRSFVCGREGKLWASAGLPLIAYITLALATTFLLTPLYVI